MRHRTHLRGDSRIDTPYRGLVFSPNQLGDCYRDVVRVGPLLNVVGPNLIDRQVGIPGDESL